MISDAFFSGIEGAWAFWHMTPREINGRIAARNERTEREIELMDTLAWMVGGYAAQAYHAPKKYPSKPQRRRRLPRRDVHESDVTLQEKLRAFVAMHNATVSEGRDR